jgi:tetratricopeptide (TPR) repeat protein
MRTCIHIHSYNHDGGLQYDVPFDDELTRLRKEGNALFLQGKYADAISRYESALGDFNPTKTQACVLHGNISSCCLKLGHAQRALDEAGLNSASAKHHHMSTSSNDTHHTLIYMHPAHYNRDNDTLASSSNYYKRSELPAHKHFMRASEAADQGITADKTFAKNYHRRSCALIALGMYKEALRCAVAATELQPEDKELEEALVRCPVDVHEHGLGRALRKAPELALLHVHVSFELQGVLLPVHVSFELQGVLLPVHVHAFVCEQCFQYAEMQPGMTI